MFNGLRVHVIVKPVGGQSPLPLDWAADVVEGGEDAGREKFRELARRYGTGFLTLYSWDFCHGFEHVCGGTKLGRGQADEAEPAGFVLMGRLSDCGNQAVLAWLTRKLFGMSRTVEEGTDKNKEKSHAE